MSDPIKVTKKEAKLIIDKLEEDFTLVIVRERGLVEDLPAYYKNRMMIMRVWGLVR